MKIGSWMQKSKLASAVVLIGAAALTVTTVVLASAPSGGVTGNGATGAASGKMATAEKAKPEINVNLVAPTAGEMIKTTEFIGKLEAAGSVSVYPASGGQVAEIFFEAGQQVRAGDLLMRLDTDDLLFDLEVAQASYEEKLLSSNKTLGSDYTSKIIAAQNSLDKANRSYRTARQKYATEADIEDNALEKADDKRNAAKTAKDEAMAAWNQAKADYQAANGGSSTGMEDDPSVKAAHAAYTEAYESYRDADDDYYYLTQQYDDSTSTAVVDKDNAYKDITQAKESLELATGAAFEEQRAVIEASLRAAQLSLQKTERAIDKAYIYAPVGGVIESRNANLYEQASSNTAAFTISNSNAVQVAFHLSSDGAAALTLGDIVTVTKGSVQYPAVIVEIDTTADSATGLFPVKASLSESGGALLPGVSVKISATTAKAQNALMLPIDYIYFENGEAYVYTYVDGKAVQTVLELGMSDAKTAVVTSGLTKDSLVITTWHPNLKNEAAVGLTEQATQLLGEVIAVPVPETTSIPADQQPPQTVAEKPAEGVRKQEGKSE